MASLSGKTALVTGASRGIGRASALALAAAGAQVVVHYGSSEKEADAVIAVIREAGGKAEKVGADLRKPEGPHALARQVRAIVGDRLDIIALDPTEDCGEELQIVIGDRQPGFLFRHRREI